MVSGFRIQHAARHIRAGGIVCYPTEGVYGLGCDPFNPNAVKRLRALKERTSTKGLILIASDFGQLEPYLRIDDPDLKRRLLVSSQDPITWIVPASDKVPCWLRGGCPGLAVRVTGHPVAARLCRAFGRPLVSTSANKRGRRPTKYLVAVRKAFPDDALLFVPGRLGGLGRPTPILDACTGQRLR